jgi:hypothetical protein
MKRLLTAIAMVTATLGFAGQNWSEDTYVIWPLKSDAPKQASVVSFSDWLVFGDATFGKPGVRFIINKMAASGIRKIWWRTFGGGHAQYTSKVPEVTMANYAGQGGDYSKYNSLKDAVQYARKLGLEIYVWYTPLEEAHGWPDNVRSRYTDLHRNLWDRLHTGNYVDAPSLAYRQYRDYKLALAKEMLDYKVDGLVLDFERGGSPGRSDLWGYLPQQVMAFNKEYGRKGMPATNDKDWQRFRAQNTGKLVKSISEYAKKKNKNTEIIAMFREQFPLNAYWDVAAWEKAGIIDRLCPVSHGRKGWGHPSSDPGQIYRKYINKSRLPVSMIIYSLNGSNQEIEQSAKNAIASGCKELVWFETTYLYFAKRYALPLEIACPKRATLTSPEYDFSKGGSIYLTAAGKWNLSIGGKLIASGTRNRVYKVNIPATNGKNRLSVKCELSAASDKAGIAIQGVAGDGTVIKSDRSWNSDLGKVTTIAQPGIPPFLAPLDTVVKAEVK